MNKATIEIVCAGRYNTATRPMGKLKYEVRRDGVVVGVGDWTRATTTFDRICRSLADSGWTGIEFVADFRAQRSTYQKIEL